MSRLVAKSPRKTKSNLVTLSYFLPLRSSRLGGSLKKIYITNQTNPLYQDHIATLKYRYSQQSRVEQ